MGFAPLPRVANKELKGFAFRTIRQIRTNALVETRIEHAEVRTAAPKSVNNSASSNAGSRRLTRAVQTDDARTLSDVVATHVKTNVRRSTLQRQAGLIPIRADVPPT